MENYISNKEFLKELHVFHDEKLISKRLHEMFYILASRISRKKCWYAKICNMTIKNREINETKSELIHEGYYKCILKIKSFDIETRENPFSYFTSIVHNCYRDFFALDIKHDILSMKAKNDYKYKFQMRYGFKPIVTNKVEE